jgi:hypothetical protein
MLNQSRHADSEILNSISKRLQAHTNRDVLLHHGSSREGRGSKDFDRHIHIIQKLSGSEVIIKVMFQGNGSLKHGEAASGIGQASKADSFWVVAEGMYSTKTWHTHGFTCNGGKLHWEGGSVRSYDFALLVRLI